MITISYLSTTSVATSDTANDDDAEQTVPRVHFCAKMMHEICFAMNPNMPAPSRTLSLLAGAHTTKKFETRATRALGDEWKSDHCRRVNGRRNAYVTLELARVYAEAKDCDVAKLIAATNTILSWKRGAIIDHISPDLFETSATVADLLAGANASANADIDVDTITVASEPYREDKNRAIDDDGDDESVEVMTTTTTTEIADAARVAGSVADDIAIIGDDDVEKAENVDDADDGCGDDDDADDGRGDDDDDDDDDDGRGDDDADRVDKLERTRAHESTPTVAKIRPSREYIVEMVQRGNTKHTVKGQVIKFKCKEFDGPVKPVTMHVVLESTDGDYIGYVDARGMCLLAEDIKYDGNVAQYIKRHEADIQALVATTPGLSRDDIIIHLDVPNISKYRTFMHPLLADRLGASLLRRRVSCPILEKHVRDTLAKSLNGTTEVAADAGRIDVVTDDEIIEVKHVAAWKHAYGQVKSYMTCVGSRHRGRIHLFGTKAEIDRRSSLIETTLAELDSTVRVTYEYLSVTDRTPVVRERLKALQSRMREVDECMEELLEFTRKVSPSAIEKKAVAIERDDDDDHGGSAERMATSDDGDDESDGNDDDDGDDDDNIDDDDDESDGIARDDDVHGDRLERTRAHEPTPPVADITHSGTLANTRASREYSAEMVQRGNTKHTVKGQVIGFKCKEFVGPVKPVIMHVVIANTDGNYIGYVDARGMCLLAEDIKYNGNVARYVTRHEKDIQALVAAIPGLSRDDIIVHLDVPNTNKYRTFMHPQLAEQLQMKLDPRYCAEVANYICRFKNGDPALMEDVRRNYDRIHGTRSRVRMETDEGDVPSRKRPREELDTSASLDAIMNQFSKLDPSSETAVYFKQKMEPVIDSLTGVLKSRASVEVVENEVMKSRASVEVAEYELKVEKIYVEKLKAKIEMAEQRLRLRVVEDRAESEVEEQRQNRKRLSDLEFDKQRRLANLHLEWSKRDRACKRNSTNADGCEGDLEWEAVDDVDVKRVPVVADENVAALSLKDADDDAVNADEEEDAIIADVEEEENELEPLPAAEAAWRALYDRRGTAENAKLTSDFAPMLVRLDPRNAALWERRFEADPKLESMLGKHIAERWIAAHTRRYRGDPAPDAIPASRRVRLVKERGTTIRHDRGTKTVKAYMYHKADESLILSEARAYFNRYCHRGATSKSTTTTSEQVTTTNSNTAPVSSARQSLLAGFFKRGPLAG
ncbi:hypothetical protein CYMTET_37377 [Cymbomonas tetramitiformis]|uniref:Uncharacterized protein n=1 Tax=Cymbomonas tetramitiformis TaxID=36881 RepID=A0AAE0CE35_9CHLO|nr:hypothetical protein CYMTET_37377 [Cymbomonas tetramitiformis]